MRSAHIVTPILFTHIFLRKKNILVSLLYIYEKQNKLSPKNFKLQFAHSFRCDGGSKTSILKSRSFGR